MRWAFKIAYWGEAYHGFQRQPDVPTVEGALLEAFHRVGALEDPESGDVQSASRTDRGVAALGNVVAMTTDMDPRAIVARTNPLLEDIWIRAYARTDPGFNPRHARERWYRCHLPGDLLLDRLEAVLPLFRGSHDFRGFAKGGSKGVCRVRELTVRRNDDWILLDLRADRFLWEMVRRLGHALALHARGGLARSELDRGLRGKALDLEPVPPERVVLMDVRYDFPFVPFGGAGLRRAVDRRVRVRTLERRFLDALRDRLGRPVESYKGKGPWPPHD